MKWDFKKARPGSTKGALNVVELKQLLIIVREGVPWLRPPISHLFSRRRAPLQG